MSIIKSCFRYAKVRAKILLPKVGKQVQEKQFEKLKEKVNDQLCAFLKDNEGIPTFSLKDTYGVDIYK